MGPGAEHGCRGNVFDRAAPTYGHVGPDFFSVLGDLLVERVTIPAGSKVIDIGAGTGAVSQAVIRRLGHGGSIVAIDIAPKMLGQLKRRLARRTTVAIASAVMDAGNLGISSGSFDVALSGIALQSMPDPPAAVAEMCRAIRSGGTFGISISKGWWWEEDPRWEWHGEVLQELGVAIEGAPPSSGGSFTDSLLSNVPLTNIVRMQEVLEFEFEGADVYWEWCWSHGWRGVMERLNRTQLQGYRKAVGEFIGEGPFPGRLVVHLATALRR